MNSFFSGRITASLSVALHCKQNEYSKLNYSIHPSRNVDGGQKHTFTPLTLSVWCIISLWWIGPTPRMQTGDLSEESWRDSKRITHIAFLQQLQLLLCLWPRSQQWKHLLVSTPNEVLHNSEHKWHEEVSSKWSYNRQFQLECMCMVSLLLQICRYMSQETQLTFLSH